MTVREERKARAYDIMSTVLTGQYFLNDETIVKFDTSETKSKFWPEDKLMTLFQKNKKTIESKSCLVEVRHGDVLDALDNLYQSVVDMESVGTLCFGSPNHPGGGFLRGDISQEVELCLSTTLYKAQLKSPFYTSYHGDPSPTALHNLIFSKVWCFKDWSHDFLDEPYKTNIITAAAVDMKSLPALEIGEEVGKEIMRKRMGYILDLFAKMGCTTLVLGGFGVGSKGNDPMDIAQWWDELLSERLYFDKVVMAIPTFWKDAESHRTLEIFKAQFPYEL